MITTRARLFFATLLIGAVALLPAGRTFAAPGKVAQQITRCHTAQLALHAGISSGAAGTLGRELRLRNRSSRVCTLFGYPGTQLLDQHQRPLPTHSTWDLVYLTGKRQPQIVHLSPGQNAYFVVLWVHIPTGNERCPAARYLRVIPPNAYRSLQIAAGAGGIDACGGRITVSPVSASHIPI